MKTQQGYLEAMQRMFRTSWVDLALIEVYGPGGGYCPRAGLSVLEVAHHWQERLFRPAVPKLKTIRAKSMDAGSTLGGTWEELVSKGRGGGSLEHVCLSTQLLKL